MAKKSETLTQRAKAQRDLIELKKMQAGEIAPGGLIVLGCSTSEVAGGRIGKASVPELGETIAEAMLAACEKRGVNAAFQCCEHLNRALVVERETAEKYNLNSLFCKRYKSVINAYVAGAAHSKKGCEANG